LPGEEIEEPSSPSLKRTEEAGIKVIHDVKSKLYIKVGYLIMHGIEFITIAFGNHVFCKGLKFWDRSHYTEDAPGIPNFCTQ
jgi:hypothetical protein